MRAAEPLPTTESGEDTAADPHDPVGQREDALDVSTALATLPAEMRVALVLVDVQGLSVREAALALSVPEGTVKSRCARARARLAPLLAPGRREGAPGTAVPRAASNTSGTPSATGTGPTASADVERGGGRA